MASAGVEVLVAADLDLVAEAVCLGLTRRGHRVERVPWPVPPPRCSGTFVETAGETAGETGRSARSVGLAVVELGPAQLPLVVPLGHDTRPWVLLSAQSPPSVRGGRHRDRGAGPRAVPGDQGPARCGTSDGAARDRGDPGWDDGPGGLATAPARTAGGARLMLMRLESRRARRPDAVRLGLLLAVVLLVAVAGWAVLGGHLVAPRPGADRSPSDPESVVRSARVVAEVSAVVLVGVAALMLALAARAAADPPLAWVAAALACWSVQAVTPGLREAAGTPEGRGSAAHLLYLLLLWGIVLVLVTRARRGVLPGVGSWSGGAVVGAALAVLAAAVEATTARSAASSGPWWESGAAPGVLLAQAGLGAVQVLAVVAVLRLAHGSAAPVALRTAGAGLLLLAVGDQLTVVARLGAVDLPEEPCWWAGALLATTAAALALRQTTRSATTRAARDADRAERAEADLRRARERLHDVEASLAGVSAASTLVRHEAVSARRRTDLLDLVTTELARLDRVARSEHPSGPCQVDDVVAHLAALFAVQGLQLCWAPSRVRAGVGADVLSEVLQVLLSNSGRHGDATRVALATGRRAGRVQIAVVDDGTGLDDEVRPSLFELGTRGRRSSGQGIGLHAARERVRRLSGDLELLSEEAAAAFFGPGGRRGAGFLLTLPAAGPPAAVRARVGERSSARASQPVATVGHPDADPAVDPAVDPGVGLHAGLGG